MLTRDTYCSTHAQQYEQQRGTATERGYDHKWRVYREQYLKNNPLCAECARQGKTTAATVVDHIIDHRGDTTLFWDTGNHQPLCATCHNAKTMKTYVRLRN